MSIVVNWDRPDGQPGWHRVGDVGEATAFVEHLRNVEAVESSRIYRLEAVPFEWRPYYRAEVGGTGATYTAAVLPGPEPAAPAAPEPPAVPTPVVLPTLRSVPSLAALEPEAEAGPEPEPVPAHDRRGLFGR